MSLARSAAIGALTFGAVLVGTALHEATHWLAVRALGGRVESVRLVPPAPQVVFDGLDADGDARVRAAVFAGAPLLWAVAVAAAVALPWVWGLVAVAVALGYSPRSGSDWRGLLHVFSAMRS